MIPMDQYKSARVEAEHAAALLWAALQRAGFSEDQAARVRPLVTGQGTRVRGIGALPIGSAVKLSTREPIRTGAFSTPAGTRITICSVGW